MDLVSYIFVLMTLIVLTSGQAPGGLFGNRNPENTSDTTDNDDPGEARFWHKYAWLFSTTTPTTTTAATTQAPDGGVRDSPFLLGFSMMPNQPSFTNIGTGFTGPGGDAGTDSAGNRFAGPFRFMTNMGGGGGGLQPIFIMRGRNNPSFLPMFG